MVCLNLLAFGARWFVIYSQVCPICPRVSRPNWRVTLFAFCAYWGIELSLARCHQKVPTSVLAQVML
jgi:hypothetical protein